MSPCGDAAKLNITCYRSTRRTTRIISLVCQLATNQHPPFSPVSFFFLPFLVQTMARLPCRDGARPRLFPSSHPSSRTACRTSGDDDAMPPGNAQGPSLLVHSHSPEIEPTPPARSNAVVLSACADPNFSLHRDSRHHQLIPVLPPAKTGQRPSPLAAAHLLWAETP